MLNVRPLDLPGLLEILPTRHRDDRGFFSETWSAQSFREVGIALPFVQDNHSVSTESGVLRGLHYQLPPFAQDKLVRVVRGAVYDVAVDIRPASPSFGKWVGLELSAERWNQVLVPQGYAHGFVTLEPHTEVIYKVSRPWQRSHERTIRFDDPTLGITWPVDLTEVQLSEKDREAPLLADADLPRTEEDA